jgi:MFS family permease
VLGLTVAGMTLVPVFIWIERRGTSPVVALELFRLRSYSGSIGSAILYFWGYSAVLILTPFYLVEARGFDTLEAGAITSAQPIALLLLSPLSGRLSDRFGPRYLAVVGLVISLAGVLAMMTVDVDTSVPGIAARFALLGLGMAMFTAPNNSSIMGSVPIDRLGTASASIVTARRIGQSVGLAVSGAIYTAQAARFANARSPLGLDDPLLAPFAIVSGLRVALLVAAAVTVLSIVIAWRVSEEAAERRSSETGAAAGSGRA